MLNVRLASISVCAGTRCRFGTTRLLPVEPISAGRNGPNTSGNRKKGKKRALEEPVADIWDDYISGEEDVPKGPGGPKMDLHLKKISLPCYRKDDLKREHKLVRCLGMKRGCTQTFTWSRQKARVLSYASGVWKFVPRRHGT
jgi:hypothetical protein